MAIEITSYAEFERAMHRAQELLGFPEGSLEHQELQELERAARSWREQGGVGLDGGAVWPEGPPQHFSSALTLGEPSVE